VASGPGHVIARRPVFLGSRWFCIGDQDQHMRLCPGGWPTGSCYPTVPWGSATLDSTNGMGQRGIYIDGKGWDLA
jgi:hypothetical protein